MRIGLLGIGHLAGFLVQGAQGAGHEFVLSPRNAERADDLARRFGCQVADSNQALVDACEMVLVCLPAAQGLEILRGLSFRPGQALCSAMAGVPVNALRAAVAPAEVTVAMMPGHANAYAAGPTLLHPPHPRWAAFFAACGPVHELVTPRDFETAAVFGAMSGASFAFMQRLIDWYQAEGLDPTTARRLVAETLRGNAEVLLLSTDPLETIAAGVATPGGITEQLLTDLAERDALLAWSHALSRVLRRMAPTRADKNTL